MAAAKKIKIWGRKTSSNVKKVLWLCDEIGLPYDRVDAGREFGVVDTPAYRALNPNGRVPTIEDGDFVLWESNSIMRYLAMKYGGEAFYPKDPAARASIDRWLDWQLSVLTPVDAPAFLGTIRTPPEKHDKGAIKAMVDKLDPAYAILDRALDGKPYLVAEKFSIAEIALGILFHRYLENPFLPKKEFPRLTAWRDRMRARPGFKTHVDVPLE
jgi:glutathione S-transferase